MNNVLLVGRLSKDVDLRFIPGSGKAVCKFTLVVKDRFKKDKVHFFNMEAWGKQAETLANYTKKGDQLIINGTLTTSNYEERDTGRTVYLTYVVVQNFEFGAKKGANKQDHDGLGVDGDGNQLTPVDEESPFTDDNTPV